MGVDLKLGGTDNGVATSSSNRMADISLSTLAGSSGFEDDGSVPKSKDDCSSASQDVRSRSASGGWESLCDVRSWFASS